MFLKLIYHESILCEVKPWLSLGASVPEISGRVRTMRRPLQCHTKQPIGSVVPCAKGCRAFCLPCLPIKSPEGFWGFAVASQALNAENSGLQSRVSFQRMSRTITVCLVPRCSKPGTVSI